MTDIKKLVEALLVAIDRRAQPRRYVVSAYTKDQSHDPYYMRRDPVYLCVSAYDVRDAIQQARLAFGGTPEDLRVRPFEEGLECPQCARGRYGDANACPRCGWDRERGEREWRRRVYGYFEGEENP